MLLGFEPQFLDHIAPGGHFKKKGSPETLAICGLQVTDTIDGAFPGRTFVQERKTLGRVAAKKVFDDQFGLRLAVHIFLADDG